MFSLNHYSVFRAFCVLLILSAFIACQKGNQEQASSAVEGDSASDSLQVNPKVSELLSSMDIYQFSETVKAPEFELKDLKGRTVNIAQFSGKVIVLSFWATW
jgi:hypothetical protein